MKYKIFRTDKASDELYEIIQYIAEDSGSTEAALACLDKLERALLLLGDTPLMGSKPRYSILSKQGYRVLPVESHLVFYKVDEEAHTVTIYAVAFAKREYLNLI